MKCGKDERIEILVSIHLFAEDDDLIGIISKTDLEIMKQRDRQLFMRGYTSKEYLYLLWQGGS